MRSELRLHRLLLAIFAVLLAGVVALLLYLGSEFPDRHVEAAVSLAIMLVVATCLVYMGAAETVIALQFGARHKQELLLYLVLGILSIASGLYLALAEKASLQSVSLVVAPHALLFGLLELRLAQHLGRHLRQRRMLLLCGVSELLFSVALVVGYRLSSSHTATLLGYVASITAMQLLAFLFYRTPSVSGDLSPHLAPEE